jgi:hypothetical protein
MAFDKEDTDAIFDVIDKTLDRMGIKTLRVDRIEHNDDIDNRIISEIESADFALADLTYSRPSVYFEAGYAQRKVPVVYTVRRDHFRSTPGDEHGNLRVHFDLQMKNIIPWANAVDKAFQKRLKARVTKIIAPLVITRRSDLAQQSRISAFERMSIDHRKRLIRDKGKEYFEKQGYRVTSLTYRDNARPEHLVPTLNRFWGGIIALKRVGSTMHCVFLDAVSSITKSLCVEYRMLLIRQLPYSMAVFGSGSWTPQNLKEDLVICSLGRGGFHRARNEIDYFQHGDFEKTLVYDRDFEIFKPGRQITLPRRTTFHIFESSSSLLSLGEELQSRFPGKPRSSEIKP